MRINTALILCAGFGKRLSPITIKIPKPLLELDNITMLEKCIKLIEKLGIKKIFINTFHLKDQFLEFLKNKKFNLDIQIVDDGERILDTGGGISNMINHFDEENFLVFNPDTLWKPEYSDEIIRMEKMYFAKKIESILLLVNKNKSFDKNLNGDFNLVNNLILKDSNKKFIYIGCQILSKKLFTNQNTKTFSILNIWNNLIDKKKLYGFESKKNFYHLTDLDTFKKLKDL